MVFLTEYDSWPWILRTQHPVTYIIFAPLRRRLPICFLACRPRERGTRVRGDSYNVLYTFFLFSVRPSLNRPSHVVSASFADV